MLFVITALDRPGALEQRVQVRPAHLDDLKSRSAQSKVGIPLLDDRGHIRPWRAALGQWAS